MGQSELGKPSPETLFSDDLGCVRLTELTRTGIFHLGYVVVVDESCVKEPRGLGILDNCSAREPHPSPITKFVLGLGLAGSLLWASPAPTQGCSNLGGASWSRSQYSHESTCSLDDGTNRATFMSPSGGSDFFWYLGPKRSKNS